MDTAVPLAGRRASIVTGALRPEREGKEKKEKKRFPASTEKGIRRSDSSSLRKSSFYRMVGTNLMNMGGKEEGEKEQA